MEWRAESWQGKSLAGGVDEIAEMLKRKAEFEQLSDAVAAVSDRHDEVVGYVVATDGDDDDIDFDNVGVAILDEDMEPIAEVEMGQAVDQYIDYDPEEEVYHATPYSNWFGACLLPDGRCFEATMSDCRALGGRFQGPGTSCGGYQQPLMMAETFESQGNNAQGNGLIIAITVGVITGVMTTIVGTILSEMWLDRLREDPELHTTPDDLNGPE